MIGLTLDLPKEEREEGTVATSVLGLVKGCSFFRVHDVKKNRRALDMTFAMLQAE
jgi:dihydropteroate synthase